MCTARARSLARIELLAVEIWQKKEINEHVFFSCFVPKMEKKQEWKKERNWASSVLCIFFAWKMIFLHSDLVLWKWQKIAKENSKIQSYSPAKDFQFCLINFASSFDSFRCDAMRLEWIGCAIAVMLSTWKCAVPVVVLLNTPRVLKANGRERARNRERTREHTASLDLKST